MALPLSKQASRIPGQMDRSGQPRSVFLHRKKIQCADLPTVPLLAGHSPAFLPDVPRPAKSWKCPAFCTKSDFLFARAQFVTLPRCPDVNVYHPIERKP